MNINGIGVSSPQNSVGGGSKDVEQKIKALEQEKAKLLQDKDKAKNPFATKQSAEYASISKKIQELDKQIQLLKAESSSAPTSDKNEDQNIISSARKFDEFVRSEDQSQQSSSGVYSVSSDENGNSVVSFNPPQADNCSSNENALVEKPL